MLAHQERAHIFGYRVPQYFWFVLSGALCDIVQAVIDYAISLIYTSNFERATVCWTLSYIISIWVRHFSHRILVFGEYEGTYCASLSKTYLTYSSSIVISMVTNWVIVNQMEFSHRQAWVFTMLWTGLWNYFLLKSTWNTKVQPNLTLNSQV